MRRPIIKRITNSANSSATEPTPTVQSNMFNLGNWGLAGLGAFFGYLLFGSNENREKYKRLKIENETVAALNKEYADYVDKELKNYFAIMRNWNHSLNVKIDSQVNRVINDLDLKFHWINDHIHQHAETILKQLNYNGKEFFKRVQNESKSKDESE